MALDGHRKIFAFINSYRNKEQRRLPGTEHLELFAVYGSWFTAHICDNKSVKAYQWAV